MNSYTISNFSNGVDYEFQCGNCDAKFMPDDTNSVFAVREDEAIVVTQNGNEIHRCSADKERGDGAVKKCEPRQDQG